MSIKAYGKFFSWEESLFFPEWENEKRKYARIVGHEQKGQAYCKPTTDPEADFSRSPGVYLLHDSFGEVMYVGQAEQLGSRLIAHTGDHLRGRWTNYSWFAIEEGELPSKCGGVSFEAPEEQDARNSQDVLSLDMLEAILRTAIEPRLNLQGGRWGDAKHFAQSVEYEFVYLREVFEGVQAVRRKNKKIDRKLKKMKREGAP